MDEEIRRTIGDSDMLCFHLNLYPMDDERGQLGWGGLIVALEGEPVWCAESECGEDEPPHPGNLHREMEKRWETMTEEQSQEEQDSLYHFVGRHDLARGLKGIFPPALFILRQGEQAWVCTNDRQRLLPFDDVQRTLSERGECVRCCESIAQALSDLSRRFNVSREVAALQVRNSRVWFYLSEEEKSFLLRESEG